MAFYMALYLARSVCLFPGKSVYGKNSDLIKNAAAPTTIITIISALCLFPGDKLTFGRFSSWVNDLYHVSPGLPKIIAGLLVGGVIEEVMMRLFFMSMLVLIISKLFYKND
jgi:hypothetical protein